MPRSSRPTYIWSLLLALLISGGVARAQEPAPQTRQKAPAFDEWGDTFAGDRLDLNKWERFTFEGGGGGKLEIRDGQLQLRSGNQTRAGVRSKDLFTGDRFSVEAGVAKVGPQMLQPGERTTQLGFASLTLLFDSSGRNRVEWILTSEGTCEAWSIIEGRGERLDNRKLGTKLKNPVLGIVRNGDEFIFVINGPDSPPEQAQVGLRKTIRNMPNTFHVMLYGFGSSENNWDSVRVVVLK